MSFPVCFAAEGFCAVGECTTVGSFVTFLMFSVKLVIISIHVYIIFCVWGWDGGILLHFTAETGSFRTNRALESTF